MQSQFFLEISKQNRYSREPGAYNQIEERASKPEPKAAVAASPSAK
jgi:hypothetical protein